MEKAAGWHYLQGDRRLGPVEPVELLRLLERGALPPDTQVWQDGMRDWVRAPEAAALGYRPRVAPPGEGGRAWLPGPLATHRAFVTDELPRLVADTYQSGKVGGEAGLKLQRQMGLGNWQRWNVVANTPTRFEAAVYLPRTSNSWVVGFRRISVRAVEQNGETFISLFETKKEGWILFAVLLLTCLPPLLMGAVIAYVNKRHTAFNKKVMTRVTAAIKARFPDAFVN